MQNLSQEELHGRDRCQHTVAPGGIPDLTAHSQDGFRLQQQGLLAGEALQDRGDVRNHLVTSCTICMCIPIYTGAAWWLLIREMPGDTSCRLPNLMPFAFLTALNRQIIAVPTAVVPATRRQIELTYPVVARSPMS
jgi:hypothetical protein